MMSAKYTLLRDESVEATSVRRPFIMFVSVVGFALFFVLYISATPSTFIGPSFMEMKRTVQRMSGHLGDANITTVTTLINGSFSLSILPTTGLKTTSVQSNASTGSSSYAEVSETPLDNSTDYYEDTSTEAEGTQTVMIPGLDDMPVPNNVNITSDAAIYEKYAIYTKKCRIKDYDYNDKAVLKKYFSHTPKMCPATSLPFVFYPKLNVTGGYSCIGFNETLFKQHYKGEFKDWKCIYKEAIRNLKYQVIDRNYDFGKSEQLIVGSCPRLEFVWIECDTPTIQNVQTKSKKYEQPLMLPLVKNVPYPLRPNNIKKKPLHVLIVGLDSVSRLNAYRQFPKTMKFLQSKKNLVELYGYNKIGLNSAPNQIPLLTGIQYTPDPGLRSRIDKIYFDNATRFLWDDYEERGYRTMFYEEQWVYGLFVYPSLKGFKKVPTTYWPRPMMQAIDKSKLKTAGGNGWCIGPDFPAKHYLDYTYNTMKILGEDRPLFSYSWLSETAHDDVNGGRRVDNYFEDFFMKMDRDGILNHTAVLFISDHGFRFGSFRATALGRYEDMLPYGFVLMPEWFYEENPDALVNLKANARRLVTVYDFHATLLELADMWSEGRVTRTANGYSIFSNVVPGDRTCKDADIDFQYCSCYEPQPYDRSGQLATSLGQFVLNKINDIVKKNNATAKCQTWSLRSIDDFARLSEGEQWTDMFKISLSTTPKAQFEVAATFMRSATEDVATMWTLVADVDRTDWFSSHAKCVKGTKYERYCYCNS